MLAENLNLNMAKKENTTSIGFGKKALLALWLCMMTVVVQAQGKIYTYDDARQDASITVPTFTRTQNGELLLMERAHHLRSLKDEEVWLIYGYRKPADAQDYENVFISFVVEPNGKLTNIQVQGWDENAKKKTTKLLPSVRREVTRIIKTMHNWTPAKKNGKAIRFRYEYHFDVREYALDLEPYLSDAEEKKPDENKVYDFAEEMPQFYGGQDALFKWLSENVKPQEEVGRCIVRFVVEKDGSLSDIKITRSVSPAVDAETLRVMKAMPKWKPGKMYGKPVRVQFTLPINFK